ncbi:hypothetical protein [Metabacillus fastidiosus]
MDRFIHDMIHMTAGEKLISYWWIWIIISGVLFSVLLLFNKKSPK